MFRVDDRVLVAHKVDSSWPSWVDSLDDYVGKEGIIKEVGDYSYFVVFTDDTDDLFDWDGWYFPEYALEIAKQEVLEPGDLPGLFK